MGLPLTVETCPHYLSFTAEEIQDGATHFKCAPPIRENENRERLWEGLRTGLIDMVVSDHSPCTPRLKEMESGDFARAWGGISGIQFSLPVVWTEMRHRGLPLKELSKLMSANPTKLAGLEKRKGRLAVGLDADLVVFDPDHSYILTPEMIRHRHRVTPYAGRELFGLIHKTFVRGTCVYTGDTYPSGSPGERIHRLDPRRLT